MPTTLNKVKAFLSSSIGDFAINDAVVEFGVNTLPTCKISVVPRTVKEIEVINNVADNLFEQMTLEVEINGKRETLFSGFFAGAQGSSSVSSINASFTLYGGLYKLYQSSSLALGLHPLGGNNTFRTSILDLNTRAGLLKSVFKDTDDLITSFSKILLAMYDIIQDAIDDNTITGLTNNNVQAKLGDLVKAQRDLYTFTLNNNKTIIGSELSKIIVGNGMQAGAFGEFNTRRIAQILSTYMSNPSVNFWDLLIALCEIYQVNIGSFRDKIYAIPHHPVGNPNLTLSATDLYRVNTSPLPIDIPTRGFFSTNGGENDNIIGMFPRLSDASKPTELEKKLGTVRAVIYETPALAQHNLTTIDPLTGVGIDSSNAQSVYDLFAQVYTLKETFKHRASTLNSRYNPNIPVGSVILFQDPVLAKTYKGYVNNVIHTLSTMTTTIHCTYVMADKEIETLGLNTNGYLDNPLYPNYNSSFLNTLI